MTSVCLQFLNDINKRIMFFCAASGGSQMWTQLVLMVVLVTGAVIGLSCAFWHFGRHAGVAAAIKGGNLCDEMSNN